MTSKGESHWLKTASGLTLKASHISVYLFCCDLQLCGLMASHTSWVASDQQTLGQCASMCLASERQLPHKL
jgi:hypothetical protein